MTKKALIVDDSRLACKVMAKMLDTLEFTSVEVYSAEEALQHLKHYKPDIIFLDHTMSGMDGLELMKLIKANQLTANIPVMMYTAKEGDYYIGQAVALGAVEVLPKGLDKKRLVSALKKIGLMSAISPLDNEPAFEKNAPLNITQSDPLDLNVESVTNEQITNDPIPAQWLSFWKQRLEPYLEKQKSQQQKEFVYNTKEQTRKLIREMHITLEQFEHALVLRMESHSDFVSATEEVTKSARRKWLASIGGLILFSQMVIFWYFWSAKDLVESQLFNQQQLMLTQNKQQQQFNQSILALTERINELQMTQNEQVKNNLKLSSDTDDFNLGVLNNEQNEFVANLIEMNKAQGGFIGTSSAGYHFAVNNKGEVGYRLLNTYYFNENCSGETYAIAERATLYKGENNSLWFVDKLAETITVNPLSSRTIENECIPISGEIMELYFLQKNLPYETGIEDNQKFKLSFNR